MCSIKNLLPRFVPSSVHHSMSSLNTSVPSFEPQLSLYWAIALSQTSPCQKSSFSIASYLYSFFSDGFYVLFFIKWFSRFFCVSDLHIKMALVNPHVCSIIFFSLQVFSDSQCLEVLNQCSSPVLFSPFLESIYYSKKAFPALPLIKRLLNPFPISSSCTSTSSLSGFNHLQIW